MSAIVCLPPPSLRYLSSPTRWRSQHQQVPPSTLPMPLPALGKPGFQQQSVSRPSCQLRRLENHMTLYCNVTVSGKSHSELNKCGFFMMYGTALYAACLLGVTTNKCVFQHFTKIGCILQLCQSRSERLLPDCPIYI